MKVRLTRPFYDGEKYWDEGTVLDLAVPPSSAEKLEAVAPVEPALAEPAPKETAKKE